MATELYDKDGNRVATRSAGGVLFTLFLCAGFTIMIAVMVASYIGYNPWRQVAPIEAPPPAGAIGNQAPPSVRGTNPDPVVPPVPHATPIPGIAQSEAESLRIYQTTIAAPQVSPPAPAPVIAPPLPQNSAGQPVIDAQQQAQLDQSAQMAADDAQAAQRQTQLTDAAQRAPDVSYADAAAELHRDPCHVPHADPVMCARGLFKPTPIGGRP